MGECPTAFVFLVYSIIKFGLKHQTLLIFLLEMILNFLPNFLYFIIADYALPHQLICISLWIANFHIPDLLVHAWLREWWLIDLIVTMLSETNHVYQNIFIECFPIFDHKFANLDHILGSRNCIRCIESNYWNAESLHNVRAISCAPSIILLRREANLVVCDNMYGASDWKLGQVTKSKWFVSWTLTAECCITMHLNIQNAFIGMIKIHIIHFCPTLAHWYGILSLQVTGIMNHTHCNSLTIALGRINTRAEFFGITDSYMRRNIIYPALNLFTNLVITSHLMQQIPHWIVI